MENICFFNEDIEMPSLDYQKIQTWLFSFISSHNYEIESINYIFCSDEYLLGINREYLDHDYYTDIITFDTSEQTEILESDIFISLDRVADNAQQLDISFETELLRVLAHGVLHLIGYNDKTEEEAQIMRTQENNCIDNYFSI